MFLASHELCGNGSVVMHNLSIENGLSHLESDMRWKQLHHCNVRKDARTRNNRCAVYENGYGDCSRYRRHRFRLPHHHRSVSDSRQLPAPLLRPTPSFNPSQWGRFSRAPSSSSFSASWHTSSFQQFTAMTRMLKRALPAPHPHFFLALVRFLPRGAYSSQKNLD